MELIGELLQSEQSAENSVVKTENAAFKKRYRVTLLLCVLCLLVLEVIKSLRGAIL